MKYWLFLILLVSSSVRADGFEMANEIFNTVWPNFTYVTQAPETDKIRVHSGESRFFGDCDDFAIAVYYQYFKRGIKATVYAADHPTVGGHTLTCHDYCIDSGQEFVVFPVDLLEEMGYTVMYSMDTIPQVILRPEFQ